MTGLNWPPIHSTHIASHPWESSAAQPSSSHGTLLYLCLSCMLSCFSLSTRTLMFSLSFVLGPEVWQKTWVSANLFYGNQSPIEEHSVGDSWETCPSLSHWHPHPVQLLHISGIFISSKWRTLTSLCCFLDVDIFFHQQWSLLGMGCSSESWTGAKWSGASINPSRWVINPPMRWGCGPGELTSWTSVGSCETAGVSQFISKVHPFLLC